MHTIGRTLHDAGYFSRLQSKKPYVSYKNQQVRLKWAQEHVEWSVEKWKQVLFSDESPFVLSYAVRERVWRQKHEKYNQEYMKGTVKHDKKINVWGCFTYAGVGDLHLVKGILEQKQYKQILIHHMLPSAKKLFGNQEFIFQQDKDPKHTANSITQYLSNKQINVLNWPPQSPDLNPIENLWSILDREAKDRNVSNENDLFLCLKKAWENISSKTIQNLISSMPRRCQACIDNNGLPTKY